MRRCVRCGELSVSETWLCGACGFSPTMADGTMMFAPGLAEVDDSYDPQVFARLASLEEGSFWFRARNRLIEMILKRHFPSMRDFLEIGCGSGFVLSMINRAFPEATLAGSDGLVEGLRRASERVPSAWLFQADARNMPFECAFDVVAAFDVLEHVDEDDAILREMFRVTRPGGGIVVTVPQHPFLWSEADDFARHRRRYTRVDLTAKVSGAGFEIERHTSFVSLLIPAIVVARRPLRFKEREFDPWAELRLPKLLDSILDWIMLVESALIRTGIDFPVGGSLLLVGRRPQDNER